MSEAGLTVNSNLKPLAERVDERRAGGGRLFTLDTPVSSVVTWRGSFVTQPRFEAGEELLQRLTVSLLDKGTRRRDRFAVAELLDDRGAEVGFDADGLHVEFSGRALRDDVEDVFALVAEQLREPLFDEDEFAKARARLEAALRRSLESTGSQAAGALSRRMYSAAHPNYAPAPEHELEHLAALTLDDVRAYHAAHFGANELITVFVGDVAGLDLEGVVEAGFGGWAPHDQPPAFAAVAEPQPPGRIALPMPDKQNVDVRMGHPVGIYYPDADYLPLYVGNFILGGNFSARLMSTIRDEMGLTYGIRSSLSGITDRYQGHWRVAVTLSQDNVALGVEATLEEVRRFVEGGVTDDELAEKKTTITGSFKVGMATTGGLASMLLHNAERGFGVDYLDAFPARIEALTRDGVNGAIQRHLDPSRFSIALAGMLPEEVSVGA